MHELSVALSILDLVGEETERHDGKIIAVHVKLGPLAGVVKEALVSAYELAREGTPFAAVELAIEDVPLVAHCPACAVDCPLASVMELRCPVCGSSTPTIVSGRELEVSALELAG
jgi:hydrogenase nickel incorporation protein HypA/HybF